MEETDASKLCTKTKPATDWLALVKQAKEQPAVSKLSSDDDNFSDLSDFENESPRTNHTLTENASKLSSSYCSSAMRGVMGKPCKLDLDTVEKGSPKSQGFNNKAFQRSPDNQVASQICSKNPYTFNNGTFCLTPKDEISSTLSPANTNSKIKNSFSFLRQMKNNHSWSQNNKGFSYEDKNSSSRPTPRIVITDEDGHIKKIDESRKNEVACRGSCRTYGVVVLVITVLAWL